MENKTFYEGQQVKIIDNTCGHELMIGSIVIIESLEYFPNGNTWDLYSDGWVFDEDDCEAI